MPAPPHMPTSGSRASRSSWIGGPSRRSVVSAAGPPAAARSPGLLLAGEQLVEDEQAHRADGQERHDQHDEVDGFEHDSTIAAAPGRAAGANCMGCPAAAVAPWGMPTHRNQPRRRPRAAKVSWNTSQGQTHGKVVEHRTKRVHVRRPEVQRQRGRPLRDRRIRQDRSQSGPQGLVGHAH